MVLEFHSGVLLCGVPSDGVRLALAAGSRVVLEGVGRVLFTWALTVFVNIALECLVRKARFNLF